jgi:hypothetical protein
MENKKIRVGIMWQGRELPVWQRQCIEKLLAEEYNDLCLVIRDLPENYPNQSILTKIKNIGLNKILFVAYKYFLFRPKSLKKKSMNDLFLNVPEINCVIEKKGRYSQYFSEKDIEVIESYNLDLILRFGFNIIRGEILNAARYGVWSFHHDDEQKYRGGPPCFWEIYQNNPETGSVLQRLTEKLDGGIILKKGIFRTKNYSYSRNIDQAYFESAKWPAMVCRDIYNNKANYDFSPTDTMAPIYKQPDNWQFIKFLLILFINSFKSLWNRFFIMHYWNVALVKRNILLFLKRPIAEDIILLNHSNKTSFNADCFGTIINGDVYIFFEEMNYKKSNRGQIKNVKVNEAGKLLSSEYINGIDSKNHISYPFIFREHDTIYLIPETNSLKNVVLYEAIDFPKKWKQKRVLMEGDTYTDTTLHKYNDVYWLFYTVQNDEYDANRHLHIAYSDELTGPYKYHPQNPVKISARSARPAGALFINKEGHLIRPAQNFCKTYGGSIVFNKIEKLTKTSFYEIEIDELFPFHNFYKDGVHTIHVINEELFLIDMKRHVNRFLSNK